MNNNFLIVSGRATRYLAEKIVARMGYSLGNLNITTFADGEFGVSFEETIRGKHVFLVQSTFPSADNLMELLLMIDAAKRASAAQIIAVIPYFGWARQDRKDKPRVAIGAKLVADMLSKAGIDRLITMDLHADQIQGFFDVPIDHLRASNVLAPYIANHVGLDNLVMASPDAGGSKRAFAYAKFFNVPMVMCDKHRDKPNSIGDMFLIGDVEGKDVVLVDDMIDTAGTICKAANVMKEAGARSVRALASHALMSGPACERVTDSALTEVIFTNSIPFDTARCPKATIVSIAQLFADTMMRVHNNEAISSQYLI
ncbi:MAG: ribose-phosphate pyrophosphokinase [Bacteroidales bacterium]|nr:ribose-phosphate pyrophosphokinase [Bacteroidales bacterium]